MCVCPVRMQLWWQLLIHSCRLMIAEETATEEASYVHVLAWSPSARAPQTDILWELITVNSAYYARVPHEGEVCNAVGCYTVNHYYNLLLWLRRCVSSLIRIWSGRALHISDTSILKVSTRHRPSRENDSNKSLQFLQALEQNKSPYTHIITTSLPHRHRKGW